MRDRSVGRRPSTWPAPGPATPPQPEPVLQSAVWLVRALEAAATVLLVCAVLRWGWATLRILSYPYEWSAMDGYFVGYAQRLFRGLAIYSDYSTPPMGFLYVPGYLVVLGAFTALFGPAVWVDRAIALVCTLATAALAGHVVRRRSGSFGWGILATALCLVPPGVAQWQLVRGLDPWIWLLALTATTLVAEGPPRKFVYTISAAVLYTVGFYSKQVMLFPWMAGTAIVGLRAPRRLPAFLCASLGLAVGLGFGLQSWSEGWFWENAFGAMSRHAYFPALLFGLYKTFFPPVAGVCVAAVLLAVWRPRAALRHPWLLYLGAWLAETVLAGKRGAADLYFVPAYLAAVIWVCQVAPAWLATIPRWGRVRAALAAVALAQFSVWMAHPMRTPDTQAAAHAGRLLREIQRRPGRVLVERADSFATLAGRAVEWEAPQIAIMHQREDVPIDHLLADLRGHRYAAVLYSGQYFNNVYWLRRTIFSYYQPVDGLQSVPISLFYGDVAYTLLVPRLKGELPTIPVAPPGS